MKINNMPLYAYHYPCIVCREDENFELWFYGAFEDPDRANEVALEIGGVMIRQ